MQEEKLEDFNTYDNKTINQLLDIPIPRPPDYESHLVKRCFDLANKKIKFFSPEDLRIMIGQNLGLDFLVPKALQVLEKEPFIEADFYEGDLFLNILKVDKDFWEINPKFKEKVIEIFKSSLDNFNQLDLDTQEELYEKYENF